MSQLAARKAEFDAELMARKQQIDNYDKDVARAGQELQEKMKAVWLKQITESQVLIEFLKNRRAQVDLRDEVIPDHVRREGQQIARSLYKEAAQTIRPVGPRPNSGRRNSTAGGVGKAPHTPPWRAAARADKILSPGGTDRSDYLRSPQTPRHSATGKHVAWSPILEKGHTPSQPQPQSQYQSHAQSQVEDGM